MSFCSGNYLLGNSVNTTAGGNLEWLDCAVELLDTGDNFIRSQNYTAREIKHKSSLGYWVVFKAAAAMNSANSTTRQGNKKYDPADKNTGQQCLLKGIQLLTNIRLHHEIPIIVPIVLSLPCTTNTYDQNK